MLFTQPGVNGMFGGKISKQISFKIEIGNNSQIKVHIVMVQLRNCLCICVRVGKKQIIDRYIYINTPFVDS